MNFITKFLYGNKIKELLNHGKEHFEDENYFAAITFYSQVLNIDKRNITANFERGKTYFEVGNFEKAFRDLKEVEKIQSENDSELFKLLSKTCYNLGDTHNSQKYARLYYEQNSDDENAAYPYARALYFNKKYDESLKITDLIIAEGVEDFYVRYLRSLILFDQNNFVSSLLEIDKAIENDTLNCFAFNLRALINIQLYNYKEAVEDFNYAIRLNPTNPIYYFNKAKLQLRIGDLIDAKASVENCIDLDSTNKNAHLLSAQINMISENYGEALESLKEALKITPEDTAIIGTIITLCYKIKDFSTAKIYLDRIPEKESLQTNLHVNSAYINYNLGNAEAANTELISAFDKEPDNIDAKLQKAIFDFKSANYEESIRLCDEILNVDDDVSARLLKARAFIKTGLYESAGNELEKISGEGVGKEYYLLKSYVNFHYGDFENALKILTENLREEGNDITQKILTNILQINSGNLNSFENLNEFKLDGENKKYVQILNGICNFENNQYHSAKYRFSNLNDLTAEQVNLIKPIIEYTNSKIAD